MPIAPGVYDYRSIVVEHDNTVRPAGRRDPTRPVLPCEQNNWTLRVRVIVDGPEFPHPNVTITAARAGRLPENKATRVDRTLESANVSWTGQGGAPIFTLSAVLQGWTLQQSETISIADGDDKLVVLKLISTHWIEFRVLDKDDVRLPNVPIRARVPFSPASGGVQTVTQNTGPHGLQFSDLTVGATSVIHEVGQQDNNAVWEVVDFQTTAS